MVLKKLNATNLYIVMSTLIPVYFVSLYVLKGINKNDIIDLLNPNE